MPDRVNGLRSAKINLYPRREISRIPSGILVGSLIIATIQFGLVILGVLPFWQFIAVGLVVILAVIVDQLGRNMGR